ncbi:MAG: 3'(2'),5'-bisphosphate nucleotidase CysQ [Alphaproteobacteria bacterium]|nr:3'(2'),5'-bisphosphate nucleotidase CysQ [Alphaproteobacteria bacterium]
MTQFFTLADCQSPNALRNLAEHLTPVFDAAGDAIMAVKAASQSANADANAPKNTIVAEQKSDGSPVTIADARAEAIILPALAQYAPDIPVISEENAASHDLKPSEAYFLVDPLDGTKEFIKADDKGAFTVNIGLIYQSQPIMGLVLAPARGQLYIGVVGDGAMLRENDEMRPISIRDVPITGAVAVASASHRDAATDDWLSGHGINETVSVGSSLKFGLVASAAADVYPRFGPTMEWDTAAGDAVLRAAGGTVKHIDGKDFRYGKPDWRNPGFIAIGGWRE